MANAYARMSQGTQNDCYHLVRSCINEGVTVKDLKAVLAELWHDALLEKARWDASEFEKELS